jgi:hypothetical protein
LTKNVLKTLGMAAQPAGRTSDCLRSWLGDLVRLEQARRLTGRTEWGEPAEPPAWRLPWHSWSDEQLAAALACSTSWMQMRLSSTERAAFTAINTAVVTACCTRLLEFHTAIEAAEEKRAKEFADA